MPSANVRVVVRFRPVRGVWKDVPVDDEKQIIHNENSVTVPIVSKSGHSKDRQFSFDKILWECDQNKAFEATGKQPCDSLLKGFNSTIFCYGQTGSGKTHTMFGPDSFFLDENYSAGTKDLGLICRAALYLFDKLEEMRDEIDTFTMQVSCLEIYREKLKDLLSEHHGKKNAPQLKINTLTSEVPNLSRQQIHNPEDLYFWIGVAMKNRTVASHSLNATSSRSHAVLSIRLEKRSKSGAATVSTINFADLAGSERQSASTGVKNAGKLKKEAMAINLSLTELCSTIKSLSEGKKNPQFRNSKLTLLLKNSLGGNCVTTLMLAASHHDKARGETIASLSFGQRCKKIKNRAKTNVTRDKAAMLKRIQELEAENESLLSDRADLQGKLTAQLEATMAEAEKSKAEDKASSEEYTRAVKMNEQMKSQLELLTNQNNELATSKEKQADALKELEAKVLKLEQQLQTAEEECKEEGRKAVEFQNELEIAITAAETNKAERDQIEQSQNELNQKVQDLEKERASLESDVKTRSKELELKDEQIKGLKEQRTMHQETLAKLQTETKLRETVANKVGAADAMEKGLKVSQEKTAEMMDWMAKNEDELVQIRVERAQLQQKNEDLVTDLKKAEEAWAKEKESMLAAHGEVTTKLIEEKKEMEKEAEAALDGLEEQLADFKKKSDEAQEELEAAVAEREELLKQKQDILEAANGATSPKEMADLVKKGTARTRMKALNLPLLGSPARGISEDKELDDMPPLGLGPSGSSMTDHRSGTMKRVRTFYGKRNKKHAALRGKASQMTAMMEKEKELRDMVVQADDAYARALQEQFDQEEKEAEAEALGGRTKSQQEREDMEHAHLIARQGTLPDLGLLNRQFPEEADAVLKILFMNKDKLSYMQTHKIVTYFKKKKSTFTKKSGNTNDRSQKSGSQMSLKLGDVHTMRNEEAPKDFYKDTQRFLDYQADLSPAPADDEKTHEMMKAKLTERQRKDLFTDVKLKDGDSDTYDEDDIEPPSKRNDPHSAPPAPSKKPKKKTKKRGYDKKLWKKYKAKFNPKKSLGAVFKPDEPVCHVTEVRKGGQLYKMGARGGDVICSINKNPVNNVEEFAWLLRIIKGDANVTEATLVWRTPRNKDTARNSKPTLKDKPSSQASPRTEREFGSLLDGMKKVGIKGALK